MPARGAGEGGEQPPAVDQPPHEGLVERALEVAHLEHLGDIEERTCRGGDRKVVPPGDVARIERSGSVDAYARPTATVAPGHRHVGVTA